MVPPHGRSVLARDVQRISMERPQQPESAPRP